MTNRKLRYSGLGLAALTVGAIAACSSSDGGTPAGGAGSGTAGAHTNGGGSSGGAPGAGGGVTAGTTATAGNAGTATGGGAGGADSGFACPATMLANPLITGFTNTTPSTTSPGNFTLMDGVPGGTFSYQAAALALTVNADTALNIKGNVKDYDGFGVYFNSCQNASGFTGVSFKIKGKAGPTGKLNFRVQTNANTAIDPKNSKGACVVPPGTTNTYPLCHASAFDILVTDTTQTVSVNFSQLKDGVPVPAVTGADVVGLEWAFNWTPAPAGAAGSSAGGASGGSGGASGGSTAAGGSGGAAPGPYDADITIDDIVFIGGAAVGGAGGASAGGASAGGAGGASAAGASAGGTGGASGGAGGKAGSGG